MVKIIPGILEEEFPAVQQKVKLVKPYVDMVHVDIMDGEFVRQVSFSDPYKYGSLDIKLGVHLMIIRPEFEVKKWASLPNVERVLVHEEAVSNVSEVARQIQDQGKKVGLSVNPETSLNAIKDHIDKVDILMVMGVEPGASGQDMLPDTFEKVREAKKYFENVIVLVDGGVNQSNIKRLTEAGVDEVVANSAIFASENIGQALQVLQGSSDAAA